MMYCWVARCTYCYSKCMCVCVFFALRFLMHKAPSITLLCTMPPPHTATPQVPPSTTADINDSQSTNNNKGGRVALRCGQLLVSAQVGEAQGQVDLNVQHLNLDELELASLRGDVQEVRGGGGGGA